MIRLRVAPGGLGVNRSEPRRARRSFACSSSQTHESVAAQDASKAFASGLAMAQGRRETMEDCGAVRALSSGYFYAGVFDGHGGDQVATFLRDHLHEACDRGLTGDASGKTFPDGGPRGGSKEKGEEGKAVNGQPSGSEAQMQGIFREFDKEVIKYLETSVDGEAAKEAGSTATVLLVGEGKMVVANVGDSKCVLCRAGASVDLTVEHRLSGVSEAAVREVKRVEETGAWVYDGRLCGVIAVSRSFGDWEWKGEGLTYLKKAGVEWGSWDQETAEKMDFKADPVTALPDVTEVGMDTESDEFLILASDGLWDVFSSQQAVQFCRGLLKRGVSPQEVAEQLVDKALQRKTQDNVVVALVDLLGSEGWKLGGAPAMRSQKKLFGLF